MERWDYSGYRDRWQRARHPLLTALLLLALAVPIVLTLLYFNLAQHIFQVLGLSPFGAVVLLIGSLIGSLINIPLSRRRIELAPDPRVDELAPLLQWLLPWVHYYPPAVIEQVVALNVGGAVIPIAFSAYLLTLPTTSWLAVIGATAIVAFVAKLFARPLPGVGIMLPVFITPIVAALAARLIVMALAVPVAGAAPVAYIAGTLGTLIGADLLNLPRVLHGTLVDADVVANAAFQSELDPFNPFTAPARRKRPAFILSIGGGGVFDGIFVAGILAPLLATL